MNADPKPTDPPPDEPPPVETPEAETEAEEPDPYGGPLGPGIDWSDPNSPLAPFYMSAGGVVAVVLLGLALLALAAAPLMHTDFWAHLKYGEWLAAHRTLPDREPLSPFTDKSDRMFDAMWLTQVGYHALFRAGGAMAGGDALRRFEGGVEFVRSAHLLAALTAVGLFGLAYRRVADSVPLAVVGMVLVLLTLLAPLAVQRPQTFSMACYAVLLCGLSRPVVSRRALFWMPALMVLWANLHGSFAAGFVLLGLLFLGRVIEVIRADGWSLRAVLRDTAGRRLLVVIGASLAAIAVLNPYGPRLFLEVARFGSSPNMITMSEWQPLDFSEARGGHWLYLGTLVLLAGTQVLSPRAFSPAQLLLIVTLGIWPLSQQRMMVWWAPLVPWIAAPHWAAIAARWNVAATESVPSFKKTAFAGVLVLVFLFMSPASTWLKTGRPRPATAALHPATPESIAAVLKGETPADPDRVKALAGAIRKYYGGRYTGKVFASGRQGEYLLWALPDDVPVMLFNHVQCFAPEYWNECISLQSASPGWWEILDRRGPGVVILEPDQGHKELAAHLRADPRWEVVLDETDKPARDGYARLFVAVRKPERP